VRIELGIYVATGSRIEKDRQGIPLTKTYTAIVPLLAAQRLPMEFEEDLGMEQGIAGVGGAGSEDLDTGAGGVTGGRLGTPGAASTGRAPRAGASSVEAVRKAVGGPLKRR
jgi:hypothetical protein